MVLYSPSVLYSPVPSPPACFGAAPSGVLGVRGGIELESCVLYSTGTCAHVHVRVHVRVHVHVHAHVRVHVHVHVHVRMAAYA